MAVSAEALPKGMSRREEAAEEAEAEVAEAEAAEAGAVPGL